MPWFSHLQPAAGGNWNGVDSKGIPRDMSEMRAVRSLSGSNIILRQMIIRIYKIPKA